MVPRQSVRRPLRPTALILCLLIMVPAAAVLVPPATAQDQVPTVPTVPSQQPPQQPQVGFDLYMKQGEAVVLKDGKRTWFLENQTVGRVETWVYNRGTENATNVPVYFWFNNDTRPDGQGTNPAVNGQPNATMSGACVFINVPAADARENFRHGRTRVGWTFPVPEHVPKMGLNITIRVNAAPDAPKAKIHNCTNLSDDELNGYHGPPLANWDPVQPDHTVTAYFVKDGKLDLLVNASATSTAVRWCSELPAKPTDCFFATGYNRTYHPLKGEDGEMVENDDHPAYVQVDVRNAGSWVNLTDWGSACRCDKANFSYGVKVTARGFGLNGTQAITIANVTGNGTGWQTVGYLPLRGMAGNYTINVTLDPDNNVTELVETNNAGGRVFEVAWLDYVAKVNATDFRTTPAQPYDYLPSFRIQGNVTFGNVGTSNMVHPEGNPRVKYRVHIPGTDLKKEGTFDLASLMPTRKEIGLVIPVDFTAHNIEGGGYIKPGKHKLVAEIDVGNLSHEINETNNRHEIDIYVRDTNVPGIVSGPTASFMNHSIPAAFRPAETFIVLVNVTDDDVANLNVTVNFTLASNSSVYRTYPMRRVLQSQDFHALVQDLRFHGNGTTEDWRYRVEVRDAFGNEVKSEPRKNLRLERWPIQTMPVEGIVLELADNASIPYATQDPIFYRVKVLEDWTGVPDQATVAANLLVNVTPAKGAELNLSKHWEVLTDCDQVPPTSNPVEIPGNEAPPECNAVDGRYSQFQVRIHPHEGEPGRWNVSVGIIDRAGDVRVINRTLSLTDAPPVVVAASAANARTGHHQANVNDSIRVVANFTDDRIVDETKPSVTAFANFTRADGLWMNRTLASRRIITVVDANGTGHRHAVFDEVVPTGQGRDLGFGGEINVTVAAVDSTGNWASAPSVRIVVNDTSPPVFVGTPQASPSIQEVNQNVTFTARAHDETNVTLRLSILSGDVEIMAPVTLASADGQNFTYTTRLPVEGNYRWEMRLVDSMRREALHGGALSIRDNLGPRFEIRGPTAVVDGVRHGSATPRIELVAYDSDAVDASSVVLVVDGQPVVPEIGPAPAGVSGLLLSYQVPPARRFSHGEVVAVNVTAIDGSEKRLQGHLNFTFKVDDVAPATRLVSFEPRHRDAANHVWNVSLATRFTLEAEDEDGLPTQVGAIRYRILGGGANSAENLYAGPFRITDAPGVYRGPLVYQIQYWAEDSVGNVNRTPVITSVFVDDAPPQLVQYFPQGRYINATFVDDRVGVSRAVAWHRLNSEPYRMLPLEPDANNLWKGVIPEGRKGDRVSYYLQAWDHLNNTETFGNASAPRAEFSATNREPAVRIVNPVTGGAVSGTFALEWNASDEDGDALVFVVSMKAPGKTGYAELAKLENADSRRYPVDSRRYQDGEYVFRVSANDGGVVKHSEVALRILNRADAIVGVRPIEDRVVVGSTVLIKAQIAKAEAVVEARLYRNGERVATHPLNDEGRDGDEVANDGEYSARVPVDDTGDYTVEIFTRYEEDGEIKSSTLPNAASFSATLSPGYVWEKYGWMLVLIGLAAVAAIGVAAWALLRRR